MKYDNREDILQLTPHWEGERDDNGRPRVSDDILKRMQHVALEEGRAVERGEQPVDLAQARSGERAGASVVG